MLLPLRPGRAPHRVEAVLAERHAARDLRVDEVGGDRVVHRVLPRHEELLAEEESPRRLRLPAAVVSLQLLALRHRVEHVVAPVAQRRHL